MSLLQNMILLPPLYVIITEYDSSTSPLCYYYRILFFYLPAMSLLQNMILLPPRYVIITEYDSSTSPLCHYYRI